MNSGNFFKVLLVFVLISCLASVSASSLWYEFNNNYANDGNVELMVFLDADDDFNADPDYNIELYLEANDLNCTTYQSTTEYANGTYALFNEDINACADLNFDGADVFITIRDMNDLNLSQNFVFYTPGFKDIDFNWHQDQIYDLENDDQNIMFNPIFYDEFGEEITEFDGNLMVYLFGPDNEYIDSYLIDGNNNVEIPFDDFNDSLGKYMLLIGSDANDANAIAGAGYKTFTFDVKAFNLIAFVQNVEEESKYSYGIEEELELVIFGQDLNGNTIAMDNIYYQVDSDDLSEYVDAISNKTEISLDDLGEGTHTIVVIGTVGDNNQSSSVQFEIVDYGAEASMKKNEMAGTKERFSGVYAPGDEDTTFFFGIKNFEENGYEEFDDDDCNNLFEGLEYSTVGFKAKTEIDELGIEVGYNNKEKLCELVFAAPDVEGEYIFNIDLNEDFNADYGEKIDTEIKLNVSEYVLFLDPIDPESAIDEDTGEIDKKADKFEFFDENLGFVVNVTNLETGEDDLNVQDIVLLEIVSDGESLELEAEEGDFDYDWETKLLIINKDAEELDSVAGGFEIKVEFDTNAEAGEISASGVGKKKTFKIGVGLDREADMGPPYVTPDENVVLMIEAKNSSDNALEYATVSLVSIYNIETLEELDLSELTCYNDDSVEIDCSELETMTSDQGAAMFNIGLGEQLGTGMYIVTVDVNDTESYDVGQGFFMVRNFFSFGFPGDNLVAGGDQFLENAYIGKDEIWDEPGQRYDNTIQIAVFVFDGNGGDGFEESAFADPSTYSIPTGTGKLFFETQDGAGRKMMIADVNQCFEGSVGWRKGGPDGVVDYGRCANILPREEVTPGFYEAIFSVERDGVTDTAVARFNIQAFPVQVCRYVERDGRSSVTCGESLSGGGDMGGMSVTPDGNAEFVINGRSPGNPGSENVQLHISLVDEKSFSTVADDLNYYLNDELKDSEDLIYFNSNPHDNNAEEDENITVVIPADITLGGYELYFDFVTDPIDPSATQHTIYSWFINVKRYDVSLFTGHWDDREIRYVEDWENGGIDTNILDTDEWFLNDLCGEGNSYTVGSIEYDTFYVPEMSGGSDFNYSTLIDLDNQILYVDLNDDCNFLNDGLTISVGDKSITTELADENGNAPMFTSVTLQSAKYIVVPEDTEPSGNEMNRDNFVGEYDVDRNFVIPILITDVDGEPLPDVNISVRKVKKVDFINKQMETLEDGYTVTNDNNTDENGIVFLKMNVEETGEYQLELVLNSALGKEKLMPWEGPVFQTKIFSSEYGFVREDRYNENVLSVDINVNPISLGIEMYDSPFFGVFNEADESYDLDGDGSYDKNYYIYHADWGYGIDDDTNFNEQEDESYGMQQWGLSSTWPTCLGDFNADGDGKNGCSTADSIIISDETEYDIEVNLLEHQGLNYSFEDFNVENNNWPDYWSTQNDGSDDTYFEVVDSNSYDGSYALLMDGNVTATLNRPVHLYEQDENYDLNFCSFANADTNISVGLFYFVGENPEDGNAFYNFITQSWDVNVDMNVQAYYYPVEVTTDWDCFSLHENGVDINIEDNEQVNLSFSGDQNSDHNFYLDDVQLNGEILGHRISFYNKSSYRPLPTEISNEAGGEFEGTYMIWTDSNVPDVSHYLQVNFMDRLRNDLEIDDANVNTVLMKRGSCQMEQGGPMKMEFLGKTPGERIGTEDAWVFNFGDLGDYVNPDSNCLRFDMRIDISAEISGSVYKDTAWNTFFVRNNEQE